MRFETTASWFAAAFAVLSIAAPSADMILVSHAGETLPLPANAGPERDRDAIIADPTFPSPSGVSSEPFFDDETLYDQEARLETFVDR